MKQPLFGIRIAELRNKKGLTQKELAEACNVDIRTIQRIEAGGVIPRMYTVRLLAKALDVEIAHFNGNTGIATADLSQPLRWCFLAGIVFSINYIPVVFQGIDGPFNFYINVLTKIIYIASCIIFFRGFYLLGKQSNNPVLWASAFLSMILPPLLNVMDLFKDHYSGWNNISVVFTTLLINAIILGVGLLIESSRRAHAATLYTIAGITTLVQTGFFLSQNFNFIVTGLIISIFCNGLLTYILYSEANNAGKQLPAEEWQNTTPFSL